MRATLALNVLNMCKKGWCGIRAGGGCLRVGETVQNTLKEGAAEKRGGETKILKRGSGASWVKGWGGCILYFRERENVQDFHF